MAKPKYSGWTTKKPRYQVSGWATAKSVNPNYTKPKLKENPRWEKEKSRKDIHRGAKGKPEGTGSWYNRVPGDYSKEELLLPQGHQDRVRTADLHTVDQFQRDKKDDVSDKESDWEDRTSVDPIKWVKSHCLELDITLSQIHALNKQKRIEKSKAHYKETGIRDFNIEAGITEKPKRKRDEQDKSSKSSSNKK